MPNSGPRPGAVACLCPLAIRRVVLQETAKLANCSVMVSIFAVSGSIGGLLFMERFCHGQQTRRVTAVQKEICFCRIMEVVVDGVREFG